MCVCFPMALKRVLIIGSAMRAFIPMRDRKMMGQNDCHFDGQTDRWLAFAKLKIKGTPITMRMIAGKTKIKYMTER
jgi:hypothetical protein